MNHEHPVGKSAPGDEVEAAPPGTGIEPLTVELIVDRIRADLTWMNG